MCSKFLAQLTGSFWITSDLHKKKLTKRLFYMLWMPLHNVLSNCLYILLTMMFPFLALWLYPDLCSNSCFVTGTGSRRRVINLKSIADALGPTKTAALPEFHALTRADVTGSFSGKSQMTAQQVECGTASLSDYQPTTDIKTVKAFRWSLFKKNQAESEKLLPTQAILRVHLFKQFKFDQLNVVWSLWFIIHSEQRAHDLIVFDSHVTCYEMSLTGNYLYIVTSGLVSQNKVEKICLISWGVFYKTLLFYSHLLDIRWL